MTGDEIIEIAVAGKRVLFHLQHGIDLITFGRAMYERGLEDAARLCESGGPWDPGWTPEYAVQALADIIRARKNAADPT